MLLSQRNILQKERKTIVYSFRSLSDRPIKIDNRKMSSRWWIGTTDNAKKEQAINNAKRSPNSNKEPAGRSWKLQVFVNFKLLIHGKMKFRKFAT